MAKKKRFLRKHAKRRALERYGITLNAHQVYEMERMIRQNKSWLISSQYNSRNRKVHELRYNGRIYRVVYDKIRHRIVTFLPLRHKTL